MRSRTLTIFIISIVLSTVLCTGATAQEESLDRQKAMETYMKLMVVNENHAFLKNFAGEWNVATTAWMQPGAQPATSSSTSKAELVLGGRYVMVKYEGLMFGQPFEGIQIVGYDNQQQKYVSFWIDNTSTAFYLTTGTRDAASNTIDDTGIWPDPMGGSSKVHAVTRLVSPDEYTYELYMVGPDGKEFKSLENRATRKQ